MSIALETYLVTELGWPLGTGLSPFAIGLKICGYLACSVLNMVLETAVRTKFILELAHNFLLYGIRNYSVVET
jgi:hypothetical protein